jgi:chromosomal replication initiator protein
LENGTLVFSTRLPFAKQHIEDSYLSHIKRALFAVTDSPLEVAIFVLDEPVQQSGHPPSPEKALEADAVAATAAPVAATTLPDAATAATTLPAAAATLPDAATASPLPEATAVAQPAPSKDYKHYSFETFVVGDSNDFAFSAAQGVAETPGLRFNPLFIYGHSGLGKTHLLLAIHEFVNLYHPGRRVIYAPTSDFVNDFTSAMASINKDLGEFRKKYYSCDVLLLDDVQYLEGKEATTNALFDIFNVFIDQRKQIVLSADRAPTEIDMDERFTSRFGSGVTASIQPPSFEMKMAIFNNYVKYYCSMIGDNSIAVPSEIAHHIISLSGSNIRELEGAISSICFAISRRDKLLPDSLSREISIDEAEQIVGKVFLHNDNRQIAITSIQQEVEQHFNISHADMIGPHRSKNITYPRQIAMYLSRRLTTKSYPEIGKLFGNKDHTTVLYAIRNVEDKYMKDLEKKIEIERLAEKITQ